MPHIEAVCAADGGSFQEAGNHVHMVALYTTWYNLARINSAVRMFPAMAARLETRLWDIGDIVTLIEEGDDQKP